MSRGKGPYPYTCPECGTTVNATAVWQARHAQPCLACTRVRNGWRCRECGSADPHHPSPCPADQRPSSSQAGLQAWTPHATRRAVAEPDSGS